MDRAKDTRFKMPPGKFKCALGSLANFTKMDFTGSEAKGLKTFSDPEVTKAWLDSVAYCEVEEVEEESSPLTDEESTTLLSILCTTPGVTYTPRTKRTTKKTPVTVRDSLRKKD